ncbi:hypothetical protein SCLCIDRAFT_1221808 [Scleroderma citrinum Foug A]|uniref:Uncharacterized protein n=1 Tax=Scleroderma citrinum Foug A TaxID=1036808 RepID=A0A0C2YYE0_9AGAM|nr:hypothetical protein SCLCIDRAFT_1221808 [Scleroderma citrinum Foug A]
MDVMRKIQATIPSYRGLLSSSAYCVRCTSYWTSETQIYGAPIQAYYTTPSDAIE